MTWRILPALALAATLTACGNETTTTAAVEQGPASSTPSTPSGQPATAEGARTAAAAIAEDNTTGAYAAFWDALDATSQAVIDRGDYVRYKTELCPPPAAGLAWTTGKAELTSPTTATVRMSRGVGALSITEAWKLTHDGERWRLIMDQDWTDQFRGADIAKLAEQQQAAGLCV